MSTYDLAQMTDEQIAQRLFESFNSDPFAKPLIRCHIIGHREGDAEATAWILKNLPA